jgi:putative hemin transport protein
MTPLRQAWLDHRKENPRARTLDVAKHLGVTEAELVLSRVGEDVTPLRKDWSALLERLPSLGPIMALTRNAHVVHERVGPYEEVRPSPHVAGAYGKHIDQRLFCFRWGVAVVAPVENAGRTLHSLQVFDQSGAASLKIYARPNTDMDAWQKLVDDLTDEDPADFTPKPLPTPPVEPDEAIDAEALREAWAAMTDTHQAHGLLREHGVAREQALRLLGREWATPVRAEALQALLEGIAEDGEDVMVFVGNPGAIGIHKGLLHKIVPMDEWLNVLDPDFNLHVRTAGLAGQWVVRKPTDRGMVWSLEVYDEDGDVLLQLFGSRTEAQSQRQSWHDRLGALEQTYARD